MPPQEPEVVIPVGEFSTEMQARFASVIRPLDIDLSRSAPRRPQAVESHRWFYRSLGMDPKV